MLTVPGVIAGGEFAVDVIGYENAVLYDNPYAYWNFNEAALASSFADLGSGLHALSKVGGVESGLAPLYSNTGANVRLDGVSGYFTVADSSGFRHTDNLTFECVFVLDGLPADESSYAFVSVDASGETENANALFRLTLMSSGGVYSFTAFHENGAGVDNIVSVNFTPIVDRLYHLIVTRRVTTKTYAVYLQGLLVGSGTYANDPTGGTNSVLNVGRSAADGRYFYGRLDEVSIYKAVLPVTRIRNHRDQLIPAYDPGSSLNLLLDFKGAYTPPTGNNVELEFLTEA